MSKHEFAICINNRGYEVSLEPRKLYEVLADTDAEKHNQIRVIDESGEDYLGLLPFHIGNHKKAQAKATEASKFRFSLSYRVAIALKCFSLANTFSTR